MRIYCGQKEDSGVAKFVWLIVNADFVTLRNLVEFQHKSIADVYLTPDNMWEVIRAHH